MTVPKTSEEFDALNRELKARYDAGLKRNALAEMLEVNEGMAKTAAWKYYFKNQRGALDFEDLAQEAKMGLMRAFEDWDPEQSRFSSYGFLWAMSYARRAVHNMGELIRIPVAAQSDAHAIRHADDPMAKADELGVDHKTARFYLSRQISYSPEMAALFGPTAEDAYFEDELSVEHDAIRGALEGLTEKQREVIWHRYFDPADLTTQEVGVKLNMTKQNVGLHESRALRRLRGALNVSPNGDVNPKKALYRAAL